MPSFYHQDLRSPSFAAKPELLATETQLGPRVSERALIRINRRDALSSPAHEDVWAATQQLYTPVAQRRVVLRATPATLTGVSGRPTRASAVAT